MKVIPAMALTACILLAAACSKNTETATTPEGDKIKQATKGDQVTFEATSKNGEKTSLSVSAKGMALPDDFAKDIPVHPKGVVQQLNRLGDTTQLGVMVALPATEVTAFYEAEFKKQGWTDAKSQPMGAGSMIAPSKDKRSVMVIIAPQDDKTTFVQMSISPKN